MKKIVCDGTVKTVKVDGLEFEFKALWRKNYSGFVHEVSMYKNGYFCEETKIQYYNRTWECYEYESAIKNVIYKYMENYVSKMKESYKEELGVSRLCGNNKKNFENYYCNNKSYQTLQKLFLSICGNSARVIEL